MADSGKKKSFKKLFVHENGEPMSFYLAPSSEKAELRADINHHGGRLAFTSEREMEGVIKMATEGAPLPSGTTDFFSIKFIRDCMASDKKLKLEDYRMSADAKGTFYSKEHLDYQKGLTDEFDDLMPADNRTTIGCSSKALRGRKKYRLNEDTAIITYLVENEKLSKVNGNAVWKDMESREVTNHTWQSMKDHYIKYLQPNLRSFALPPKVTKALNKFYPSLKMDSNGQDDDNDDDNVEIQDSSTDSESDVISVVSETDETLLKAAQRAESESHSSSSTVVTKNGNHGNDLDPQPGTSAESGMNNEKTPVRQTPLKVSNIQAPQEISNKSGPSFSDNLDSAKESNKSPHRRKQRLVMRADYDSGVGKDLPGPSGNDNNGKKSKSPTKLKPCKPLRKTTIKQALVQKKSRQRRQILLDDSNTLLHREKRSILTRAEGSSKSEVCGDIDSLGRGGKAKRARTASPPRVAQNNLIHRKIPKFFADLVITKPSAVATRSKLGRSSSGTKKDEMVTPGGSGDETEESVTVREQMGSGDESGGMETARETLSSDCETDVSPSPMQTHVNETVMEEDEQGTFREMDESFEEGELHLDSDESEDDDARPVRLSKQEADEVFEGMASSFRIDADRIKTLLWAFSGVVEDVLSFLQGVDLPYWTRQDDENLCSGKNPDSLDKFTRSQKKTRLAFLKPVKKTYVDIS